MSACAGLSYSVLRSRLTSMAPELEGIDGVREVLRRLRLEQYEAAFDELGYDDLPYLMWLVHERERSASDDFRRMVRSVQLKPGHASKLAHCLPLEAVAVMQL